MAHVSPEFIRLDPLNLVWLNVGQRLARHFLQHPIHHRVVAHPHQPFGRPQADSLKIVRQGVGPLRRFYPAMIQFPAGLAAPPAQPALPSVAAAAVLHHRFAPAMLALHAQRYRTSKLNQYLLSNPQRSFVKPLQKLACLRVTKRSAWARLSSPIAAWKSGRCWWWGLG